MSTKIIPGYYQSKLPISRNAYISNSKIKAVLESKERAWAKYFGGVTTEPTTALLEGRMYDEALLKPDEFQRNSIIIPFKDFRTKEAQMWRDETLVSNPRAHLLTKDKKQEVMQMIDCTRSHPKIGKILEDSKKEAFGYAYDESLESVLLSMCDLRTSSGMIGDLKTTVNSDPSAFMKQQFSELWYMQLAFYDYVDWLIKCHLAGKLLPREKGNRFYIAVERKYPFISRVIALDAQFEQMGDIMWSKGARIFSDMMKRAPLGQKEIWFEDSHEITEISPTYWMITSEPEFSELINLGA